MAIQKNRRINHIWWVCQQMQQYTQFCVVVVFFSSSSNIISQWHWINLSLCSLCSFPTKLFVTSMASSLQNGNVICGKCYFIITAASFEVVNKCVYIVDEMKKKMMMKKMWKNYLMPVKCTTEKCPNFIYYITDLLWFVVVAFHHLNKNIFTSCEHTHYRSFALFTRFFSFYRLNGRHFFLLLVMYFSNPPLSLCTIHIVNTYRTIFDTKTKCNLITKD